MTNSERNLVLILFCICLTLLFFRLGARPLWDVDEGMHAVTSKEMILTGDWITTTFNGKNFYDKPVLYNWFVAIAFLIFGFTEFAARLPAAILGFGCVVLTYLLGKKIFGSATGFLGGMILTTSGMFLALSRSVVHDVSLAFFVTLAFYFFYSGYTSDARQKIYFLLFYASMGFAVLAKGPLGVVLPGLVICLLLLLKGRLSFLKEMQMGWGILIVLVIAAPWYVLISLNNSDYAGYFFIQNNLMRFLSPNAQHARPFWFYVPVLMGGFSPWSFFLPLVFINAFRSGWRALNEGTFFLVLWFGAIFLFFSAASSKGNAYLLPLFPAASLLVGNLWHQLSEASTPWLHKGFIYSFLPLVLTLIGGLIYALVNPSLVDPPLVVEQRYGVELAKIRLISFVMVGIVVFSFVALFKNHYRICFGITTGLMVLGFLVFIRLAAPMINPYRSTIGLAQKFDTLAAPGEKMVFFGRIKDSALFYADRKAVRIVDDKKMIEYLRSNPKALVIMHKMHLQRVEILRRISYVIDSEGNYLLVAPTK